MTPVFKQFRGPSKGQGPIVEQWVRQEMKRRGITRAPKGF